MRKLITRALAAAALFSSISSACLAQSATQPQYDPDHNPNFTLHNAAHRDILHVYLSRDGQDSGDLLEGYVVHPHQSTNIDPGYHCHHDITVVMDGDRSFTWYHVNFCGINTMSIHWDDGMMQADYS